MRSSERSFSWRPKRIETMINKRPEILAPCGNPAAFRAALSAGADAVYLAPDRFGARAYAGNFTETELLQTIEEAHLHDVKVYLTLNTLLRNSEMKEIPDIMDPLYTAGLDAVLVQDLGLYRLLRERYPELPLHASTQMNICSKAGAAYAKQLGFTRVVPARELSLAELREIREEVGIEVEAFVHGAMCVCYSGRCYLSSFAGGRSGNRGRCAQPCRQRYNGKYPLSMKDLCTLEDVPRLMEAGIDSLKIEGRMKNEYYVAACVDAYRQMTEDCLQGQFTPERAAAYRERLTEVFHRGGFTRGYLSEFSGPDMRDEDNPGHIGVIIGVVEQCGHGEISFRCRKDLHKGDALELKVAEDREPIRLTSPVDVKKDQTARLKTPNSRDISRNIPVLRVRNAALTRELEERFLSSGRQLPVTLSVSLRSGQPLQMTATSADISFTAEGGMAEAAKGKPVSDELLLEKIGTLSGTGCVPERITIENDETSFLPASVIKTVRRDAIDGLKEALLNRFRREMPKEEDTSRKEPEKLKSIPKEFNPICFASSLSQAEAVLAAASDGNKPEMIIFEPGVTAERIDEIRAFRASHGGETAVVIGFPYIYRTIIREEVREKLRRLAEETDGVYLPGIDSLAWFLELGIHVRHVVLGSALYRYNDRAVVHFTEAVRETCDRLWMEDAQELESEELRRMSHPSCVIPFTTVYGHLPMMLTVQRGEAGTPEQLRKEDGSELLLYPDKDLCYNVLLSGRPVLQDPARSVTAYRFTIEDEEAVRKILNGEVPKGIRHRGLL